MVTTEFFGKGCSLQDYVGKQKGWLILNYLSEFEPIFGLSVVFFTSRVDFAFVSQRIVWSVCGFSLLIMAIG